MLGEEQTKMLNKLQFSEPKDKAYLFRAVPHPALKYILHTLLLVCFVNFENVNSLFLHSFYRQWRRLSKLFSISFSCYKAVCSWYKNTTKKTTKPSTPIFIPLLSSYFLYILYIFYIWCIMHLMYMDEK